METIKAATHTPGPWRVDTGFAIPQVIADCFPKNATCVAIVYGDVESKLMARVPAVVLATNANAQAIAAVPEMLQALREVVGAHAEAGNCFYCLADRGEPHEDDCTMLFVNEAIAKAEGAR